MLETTNRFANTFSNRHAVLAVIHVASVDQAVANAQIAADAGCDGVFLIEGGGHDGLDSACAAVRQALPDLWVGANYLGLHNATAIRRARAAGLDGLWTDNAEADDASALEAADAAREGWDGLYFAGVAFKYQSSSISLEEEARAAVGHVDILTTSGDATGSPPTPEKVRRIREAAGGNTPVAIASGITPDNVSSYTDVADAFLVATGISRDWNQIDPELAKELMEKVRAASAGSAGGDAPASSGGPENSSLLRVYYSDDYAACDYSFETTRKASWIVQDLRSHPVEGVEIVAPAPLTEEELAVVHSPEYIDAVRSGSPRHLATSQGFTWDPAFWGMVCASNGGALEAARAALRHGVAGSLSSGLHHARADHGAGFCTFNGLAVAAKLCGARKVLILDLDAHCGGGTWSLVRDDPAIRQVDISVSYYDTYGPDGDDHLEVVQAPGRYLPAIEEALAALDEEGAHFDLCLYNAGMDAAGTAGGLSGIDTEMLARREALVFNWCRQRGLPVAFVLAGGYLGSGLDEAGLVALHRITIEAAARSAAASANPLARPRPGQQTTPKTPRKGAM